MGLRNGVVIMGGITDNCHKGGFMKTVSRAFVLISLLSVLMSPLSCSAETATGNGQEIDRKVSAFLEKHRYQWRNLNVPEQDGKYLYDLIIENQYKNALEIGTSTGHSAIWIAWALSKTGGRLITIEIDEAVYNRALANFEEAGLSDYIDARLANAHDLVKALEGPFDYVFCDADKEWYTQYFIDVAPKLTIGGCFTAHNIPVFREERGRWGRGGYGRGGQRGIKEFVDYVLDRSDFETTLEGTLATGISVSYKRR